MKKDKLKKQHAKLYNAVWDALHAEDKFVVTSKLCHEELVAYLADVLRNAPACGGFRTETDYWAHQAEAAIKALQLSENQDAFAAFARAAEAPEEMPEDLRKWLKTWAAACTDAPIHSTEDDYQHFLSYGNLRDHDDLRQAFYAGANAAPPDRKANFDPRTHLMTEPPDHESDFQDFLRAYDMLRRIERLLRVAYLVGAGDAQTPERPANSAVNIGVVNSGTGTWQTLDGMWHNFMGGAQCATI